MAETVKYVDLLALALYHKLNVKYINNGDALNTLESDPFIENDIEKHTVEFTPGSKNDLGDITPRKIKVNIDNESIVFKNINDGATYTQLEANDINTSKGYVEGSEDFVHEGDAKPAEWRLGVADSALIQYVSGNGVNVAAAAENPTTHLMEKIISANVKSGEKVLSVSENGLQTTLDFQKVDNAEDLGTLGFGTNVREAYVLTGINGDQVSNIAIPVYKDNQLVNVEFVSNKPDEYYTQDEIDAAQEGDDAYGKTTEDVKSPAGVGQYFKYTYTIGGKDVYAYLNASSLIAEAETGNGIMSVGTEGAQVFAIRISNSSEKRNYTAKEVSSYNAALDGAVSTADNNPETGENYTKAEADAFNATLEGAISTSDLIDYLTFDDLEDGKKGLKIQGIENAVSEAVKDLGTVEVTNGKYFTSISAVDGTLVKTEDFLPTLSTIVDNTGAVFSEISVADDGNNTNTKKITNTNTILSLYTAEASANYTLEEADAYNNENGLTSGDEGFVTTASMKPAKDGLVTAVDAKSYIDSTVSLVVSDNTLTIEEADIRALFTDLLTELEISGALG